MGWYSMGEVIVERNVGRLQIYDGCGGVLGDIGREERKEWDVIGNPMKGDIVVNQ